MWRRFHCSYILLFFSSGFIFGVLLAFVVGFLPPWFLLLPAFVTAVLAMLKPIAPMIILALVAGVFCGGIRTSFAAGALPEISFTKTVKQRFLDDITSALPEPESQLGTAYLLGEKAALPDSISQNIKAVGLAHIVVASGTHLSILIGFVRKIFQKVSRGTAVVFASLFIILFAAMLDYSPSILRAGIISILSLCAWYCGRKFSPIRIIILAAFLTLLINPVFLTELGWQMSFLSFAGVMLVGPIITKIFFGKKPGMLVQTIISTLSATILTLPLTLFYFGSFSLLSPLANLLILPTLPFALGLTFFAGLTAPYINIVFAFLATKLLSFHLLAIDFFAQKTEFLITLKSGNTKILFSYFAIVLILLLLWWKNHPSKKQDFTFGTKNGKIQRSRNIKLEKTCQDTVSGQPPNAKKQ